VTLAVKGPIPAWFVVIVISRDVMLSLGTLVLALNDGTIEIAPSSLGKVTTFLQFTTILATILLLMDERLLFLWKTVLFAAALTTVLSGLHYLYRGLLAKQ
jgi:phosphatidylglycerophosphate synthase